MGVIVALLHAANDVSLRRVWLMTLALSSPAGMASTLLVPGAPDHRRGVMGRLSRARLSGPATRYRRPTPTRRSHPMATHTPLGSRSKRIGLIAVATAYAALGPGAAIVVAGAEGASIRHEIAFKRTDVD